MSKKGKEKEQGYQKEDPYRQIGPKVQLLLRKIEVGTETRGVLESKNARCG